MSRICTSNRSLLCQLASLSLTVPSLPPRRGVPRFVDVLRPTFLSLLLSLRCRSLFFRFLSETSQLPKHGRGGGGGEHTTKGELDE